MSTTIDQLIYDDCCARPARRLIDVSYTLYGQRRLAAAEAVLKGTELRGVTVRIKEHWYAAWPPPPHVQYHPPPPRA